MAISFLPAIVAAVFVAAMALGEDEEEEEERRLPSGVPDVPPASTTEAAMLETRMVDSLPVQYFSTTGAARARLVLESSGLVEDYVDDEIKIYRVVPYQVGFPRATDAMAAAQQSGLAVLGSLSLLGTMADVQQYTCVVRPERRPVAAPGSGWAVLYDAITKPGTAPGAAPGTIPSMPGAEPTPGTEPWAQGMPPELAAEVRAALADDDIEPEALDRMADRLEGDYPLAAAALRKRAKELRAKNRLEDERRGGSPYTIRENEFGSDLAYYYTGTAGRYREIPECNPGMVIVKGDKWEYLQPWVPGTEILLPLSWECWKKPLPPVASGGQKLEPSPPAEPVPTSPTQWASYGKERMEGGDVPSEVPELPASPWGEWPGGSKPFLV